MKTDTPSKPNAIFIGILLLCAGIPMVTAVDNGALPLTSPTVFIENYQLTPSILMPGDTGTLSFTIRNTNQNSNIQQNSGIYQGGFATTTSTDINVFIENIHLEGNGIVVKTPDFERFGAIGPGQSVPVTFLVQAPVKDGIYFPEIWIDIKDGTSTRYPVPVNVNTHIAVVKKPELILQKTIPEGVIPGDDFNVTLNLRNDGDSRADDIAISINSSTSAIALKSPANFYLDHLDPGTDSGFSLQFASDKKSPLGLRDLSVSIRSLNPDGTITNQVEHIGIPVKGKAEIGIKSLTTDPIRINSGDPFTIVLRIENTGTDDAKSVQASVDLPMTGNKAAFVGKIGPDNDAPALFYLKDTGSGDIPYTLRVQYSDEYGDHTVEKKLTLSVAPANNSGLILMVVALIAIGGA
ncbi:MAG: S-layer protein, partial [Methanoregula sp.]|nr:S-layer protein [Methanoregula sp.]